MAFDGLTTRAIVLELNKLVFNGKINKVYQPNKNEIILDIYNKKKFLLNICIDSSNCRINLTTHLKENPKTAPNFCMILRKYLVGSKIVYIESYNLDRIVFIEFESYNELNDLVKYKLIIELMGKHSNIILINNSNTIIDSLRHIYSAHATRIILPANPYSFPISNKLNLLNTTQDNFIDIILQDKKNLKLTNKCCNLFSGISNSFMFYTISTLAINNDTINKDDLIKLYNYILDLLKNNVNFKEYNFNNKKDFVIIPSKTSNLINSFIDNFYFNKEEHELFINYKNSILKLILAVLTKYKKKLGYIDEKLNECNNMDLYKLYGELITANLYKINNNIKVSFINLENYYDNNKIIKINLDTRYSPSYNAKLFFKKYNKLKNTLNIVTEQKMQILEEISYLKSIVYSLENANNTQEVNEIYDEISENLLINKKENKSKQNKSTNINIETVNIDGFTIYIGKNNKQNDFVTFKLSSREDIWFHVQDFHGSHVLLKTNGKEILDTNPIIIKCAKLAVLHSQANNSSNVLVDYTLAKNIKKPKGSKPGFVIFNKYKTLII